MHKQLIWQGKFAWQYQRDQGQAWNNTSLHPDVQPYLWADAATGRWDRNHFDAQVQVGSAYAGNWQWGAGLFFEGGEADRFNDPKPLYRYRRLGIVPEVALRLGNRHWLAVQLLYISYSEDNEMGFFSIDDPLLFRLRGYGTFTRTPFVSGERQLGSQTLGGSIRWVHPKQWEVQVGGRTTRGSAQEGVSIVTNGGDWQTLQARMYLKKVWESTAFAKQVMLSGIFRENEGKDAVFQAINARLQTAQFGIGWKLTKSDTTGMRWQFQAETGFTHRLQKDIATFTEAQVQRLPLAANFGATWQKKNVSPFVSLGGNYLHVLSSNLQVGSNSALTELINPDFEILSASAFTAQMAFGMAWQHNQGMFQFSASLQRRQAINTATDFFQNQFGLSLAFSPKGNLGYSSLQGIHPSPFNPLSTL